MVDLRIVSLIPSATEIVAKLGYGKYLVGRSHECDFPAFVQSLPICTEPKFDPVGTSRQIHERVSELLISALSVYNVKTDLLAQLRPTHIVTQSQCEVCAVSLSDVEQAVKALIDAAATDNLSSTLAPVQIISLQPERLADVWTDMARVAAALSHNQTSSATAVINGLKSRLPSAVATAEGSQPRPNVVCVEWSDPLMAAGNWVPELVTLAGGADMCGKSGEHSDWMSWETLKTADPDMIIVMPCGYDIAQTRQATTEMATHPYWSTLSAVRHNRVYLTDGNQYFNRPGPRLVESYEILSEIIQQRAVDRQRQPLGWERF